MKERLQLLRGADGAVWAYRWALHRALHPRHRHDELELNLVRQGSAVYLVGDRRVVLLPRSLIWLFPEQEHLLIDHSPDFEMWIAVFRRRFVRRFCLTGPRLPLLDTRRRPAPARQVPATDARLLEGLLRKAAGADVDRRALGALLGSVIVVAWDAFGAARASAAGETMHPSVERAARLLADPELSLSLDQLARRCGLSPARLSRLFKRQTGVPLVRFRNRLRVARFVERLLETPDANMLHAALEVGFGSYPQFFRAFVEATGVSPRSWHRRAVLGADPQ
jgi:AraC-like DNA-binding protein